MSVFDWLRNFREGRRKDQSGDEWITVPFRFAEAARVSLHTVGVQPQVPLPVRIWINSWLDNYNNILSMYMREKYGEDIFPTLDGITSEFSARSGLTTPADSASASWEKWENQFRDGQS